MNMSKIRDIMERSDFLIHISNFMRKIGLVHLYHKIQSWYRLKRDGEGRQTEFYTFYCEHKSEFEQVLQLLEDDFSRFTLEAIIKYRIKHNIHFLDNVSVVPQYFLKDIVKPVNKEVFVDGGAYIGDTAKEFIKRYIGSNSFDYYAWEADPINRKRLEKNLKSSCVKIVPYGMWSEEKDLHFNGISAIGSRIDENGNSMIHVNTIDQIHKNHKVSFIKMDIEGAEIEALKGAEFTIKERKPKLAISIYHSPEHLYKIPMMIHNMVPEYKLYIRHHSDNESDTVLYAVL